MKSVFVLTYHWIDMPQTEHVKELFNSLNEAEEERDRLVKDQKSFADTDTKSKGKLEITIDRYNFDVQCSQVRA